MPIHTFMVGASDDREMLERRGSRRGGEMGDWRSVQRKETSF